MIVYQNSKKGFLKDIELGIIENLIEDLLKDILNIKVSTSEKNSWKESLIRMYLVLNDKKIDDNLLIAIEYQIPGTSKRIDFMVLGDKKGYLVELKQWQEIKKTDMPNIVKTFLGNKERETIHPSYQVYSYSRFLIDFNEYVRKNIDIKPVVFMHNMERNRDFLEYEITKETEIFFAGEIEEFRKIFYGLKPPKKDLLEKIDSSAVSPSKSLIDSLKKMLEGNEEFILLDEQRLVFEKALDFSGKKGKKVFIVKGGPGSGKSVVAINLLVEFIKKKKNARYVTKNSAPREVYKQKLKGKYTNKAIDNLFTSSGSFVNSPENEYDVLIVDESHRLNEKSGLFAKGENQIKEIINASKLSIFFIDEDQKVTFKDIGSVDEIKKWAEFFDAEVYEEELKSQFRCKGSDGYLAWLDDVLEIRESANKTLDGIDYDFRVFDDIDEMYKELKKHKNSAIVAGYCWDWISKKENRDDIVIGDFSKKWNLAEDGFSWLLKNPLNQVGCIHTVQGLEVDYIGVIIGEDLIYNNGIITQPEKRAKTDKSLSGYKKMLKNYPVKAEELADKIIKNTYKTLMTRGMKGCFVYAVDENLRKYLKERIRK
jgi:DUF2075 family protein